MQINKFMANSNLNKNKNTNTNTNTKTNIDKNKNSTNEMSTERTKGFDKIILSQNKASEDVIGNYNAQNINLKGFTMDKGTAAHTTVFVNRSAYDQILSATTFGNQKWEEMGVDDEKRWVVINGQRFECEHTQEEKALRKRLQKTLLDYFIEADQKKAAKKNNGNDKPKGNIEALINNKEVMALLGGIFHVGTADEILKKIS